MPDLAELIGRPATDPIALRMATVTATTVSGTCSVAFGRTTGSYPATPIAGVRLIGGAVVSVGDQVAVLQTGYDLVVLGKPGATTEGSGVAKIGTASFYGDFAGFAHSSRWAAGQYALLQESNGTTYINAYQNGIHFRRDNNELAVIDDYTDTIRLALKGTDRFGNNDCMRFFTDGEIQCWSIGIGGDNNANAGLMVHNNWIRMKATYGLYWEDYAVGWTCSNNGSGSRRNQIVNYNGYSGALLEMYGQGVRWTNSPIIARGLNTDVGFCVHHDGVRNSGLWLGWGDGHWRADGDGYFAWLYAHVIDTSSIKGKHSVRALEKGAGRAKIKALKPTRFKRRPSDDKPRVLAERSQGIWRDQKWNDWVDAEEDRDWVGFIAEEVAEAIPEAAPVDCNGEIGGVTYGPIIAHLVDLVQELDERLDALEKGGT